ncbi:MAG: SPFH domain-containing protein [Lachnospiraceae bacterium]|nr:SPFH domain-containing protein [Lachnospiraceae bacterium]
MGFFHNQLSNVVEWQEEFTDDVIFKKWDNDEIKKGSKLFIRPGQDAIFYKDAAIEGIFTEDGEYDIESQIIPFLSSLKGFKFGFNSGMRAEVLFVNTKEFTIKWGTKNPISIPTPGLPGGMPIRSFGNFSIKVSDYVTLIEKVAGVKTKYTVEDVKDRVVGKLDQMLMKWIAREGKDMFNLQINAQEIGNGIKEDLNAELSSQIGISVTDFSIQSFTYPEEITKMQQKAAAQAMIGDVDKYTKIAVADGMENGTGGAGEASNMAGMIMGMQVAQQMVNGMNQNQGAAPVNQAAPAAPAGNGAIPNFCPNCGKPTNGANFCGNCGHKLV